MANYKHNKGDFDKFNDLNKSLIKKNNPNITEPPSTNNPTMTRTTSGKVVDLKSQKKDYGIAKQNYEKSFEAFRLKNYPEAQDIKSINKVKSIYNKGEGANLSKDIHETSTTKGQKSFRKF